MKEFDIRPGRKHWALETATLALEVLWKEHYEKIGKENFKAKEGGLIKTLNKHNHFPTTDVDHYHQCLADIFIELAEQHDMDFKFMFGTLVYKILSERHQENKKVNTK